MCNNKLRLVQILQNLNHYYYYYVSGTWSVSNTVLHWINFWAKYIHLRYSHTLSRRVILLISYRLLSVFHADVLEHISNLKISVSLLCTKTSHATLSFQCLNHIRWPMKIVISPITYDLLLLTSNLGWNHEGFSVILTNNRIPQAIFRIM